METQLRFRSIPFCRLDGKLSLKERMRVLETFRSSNSQSASDSLGGSNGKSVVKRGSVLLMSMNAGGEGLNLVAASSAFVVEPWWNSAREDVSFGIVGPTRVLFSFISTGYTFFLLVLQQCINRIHRFGQNAAVVRVRKFVVKDSVEERIVELQKRKAFVANEVYSDAGGSAQMEGARLSLDDFRLIFRRK
jgi:SNF2 family DNA or RNA helicase